MTYPTVDQPNLNPSTIIPEEKDLFIPYMTDLYQNMAEAINNKDNLYFDFAITSTAQSIPNVPNFGAFIITVSGTDAERNPSTGAILGWLPTLTASLCKSDPTAAGSVTAIGSQAGTGSWAGNVLTITSTATNFQIAHNRAGVTGNFNIKFIGTQI